MIINMYDFSLKARDAILDEINLLANTEWYMKAERIYQLLEEWNKL